MIDETQNLLANSRVQQQRLLNLLRCLGNELQIPLVAVGTAEALRPSKAMISWSIASRCPVALRQGVRAAAEYA